MCGVVAFACSNPSSGHLETLLRIYEESQIRGTHSFGYASNAVRRFHLLSELKASLRNEWPLKSLVGHNRYCTGESWRDLNDCQPLPREGRFLAFNGVIDMSAPVRWPDAYGATFQTANDAEIALVQIERGRLLELLESRRVSFAGAWTDGKRIFYARNARRPLWAAEEDGGRFLASTRDILLRAGLTGSMREVALGKIHELN